MPAAGAASAMVTDAARRIRDSPSTGVASRWAAQIDATELLTLAGGDGNGTAPTPRQTAVFDALVRRRVAGEPMALIAGYVDFLGLEIRVRPGVFAPRPSSAGLVTAAVARLRKRRAPVMVDAATGAGPIALAVARSVPRARVLGTDIAADAVATARANARRLGLPNARFVRCDLLDGLPQALRGRVDVLTVHPPYVPSADLDLLPDEVSRFEPVHTLTDGSHDGLGLVRRLAEAAEEWLVPGGWLLVEVSADRARGSVAALERHLGDVRRMGVRGEVTRLVVGRR